MLHDDDARRVGGHYLEVQLQTFPRRQPFEQQRFEIRRRGDGDLAFQPDQTPGFILLKGYGHRVQEHLSAGFWASSRDYVAGRSRCLALRDSASNYS